tara:strand:+ start:76 stop:1260 length:1185 start_codon:yes stop_codon:yes gene_type:complete
MNKKKPIVVFDFPGHPFQYDLSKKLSIIQDNPVIHIYNPSQLGPKTFFEDSENFEVMKIDKTLSRNHYKRLLDEFIFAFLLVKKINKINPSLLICSNNPLIPQLFIYYFCKIKKIKFVFWLQDIISIAAENILKKQKNFFANIVSNFFKKIEFYILENSDHIVTISPDFDTILDEKISNNKITCIPNWAPINDIPIMDKKNNFSVSNKLTDKFNILYSGTLGFKHNPDVLIGLAHFIKNKNLNINLVIVSEGPVVDYLKSETKNLNLDSIIFLPFQDFQIFPEVLASADISLVLLEKEAGEFSVPSKLLSILCSGKIPIVFVPESNLSAKIVSRNNCGYNVNSSEDLYDTVLQIYNNPDKSLEIGLNARSYAEKNFNIDDISSKFLNIINNLLN